MSSLLALFLVCLAACSREADLCAFGVHSSIESEELRQLLVEDLNDLGVEFQIDPDGRICYRPEQSDLVRARIIELDLRLLPPATRFTFPSAEWAQIVMQALEDEGTAFSYMKTGEGFLIGLQREDDIDRARAIVEMTLGDFFQDRR